MALPTVSVLNAAIDTIYSVFTNRKTRPGNRYAVGLLQKMRTIILNAYNYGVDFTVTNEQDESLEGFFGAAIAADTEDLDFDCTNEQDPNVWAMFQAAATVAVDIDDLTITNDTETLVIFLLSGEGYAANSNAACVAGDVISVVSIGDTTDNKFAAAKGSAPANEDQFLVTSTSSIFWLGNKSTDFLKGELWEGDIGDNGADAMPDVGDTFRVQDSADTKDNALAALKGSAIAAEDLFIITNLGSVASPGSAAVAYLGYAAVVEGELREALGRAPKVGDLFQVGGTGDTYANELATLKGSAVADGDVFEVTAIGAGSVAAKYLGAKASISLSDEEQEDFVSIGS